ncbi:MAG: DUF4157 domain-containing protein [Acidobacteria bacterium]|nr:DUF4157 domain-containing protein [Acidobacteriota bacterium]
MQRHTRQVSGEVGTAHASVDRILTSPRRPLDPSLQREMGLRFGHDFSRVRVHPEKYGTKSKVNRLLKEWAESDVLLDLWRAFLNQLSTSRK